MNPGPILQADQINSVLDDLFNRLKDLPPEGRAQAEQDLRIIRDSFEHLTHATSEQALPNQPLQSAGESRWIDVLESMHDSFLAIDNDWNLIYINQRYA